jgi:hypothetical protein
MWGCSKTALSDHKAVGPFNGPLLYFRLVCDGGGHRVQRPVADVGETDEQLLNG